MRYYDEVNCGKSDYLDDFESSFKQNGASFGLESRVESGIPWMVRIVDHNKTTICSGVLVTQLHVLTNFGCLKGIEELIRQQSDYKHLYNRYQVRIGEQSSRDVCDSDSDGILNCSSEVIIRYINALHLPHSVLNDDIKYGVIELNKPVTSIPHACIYQYQMDFLGLEEKKEVENVISLMWGIEHYGNFKIFELVTYFFKESFDYKNKTFADSFGCKFPEDYLMIKENIKSMFWYNIFKGAPLFRRVKDNQFGVYGIGEDTCLKNSNKIKHPQELFFLTLNNAQDFLFNSLNEVNHDEEIVGNEFHDISKFYDKDTCGKIQKEDIPHNTDSFTNEVSYPWILTIVKGGRACMGTLINKMHVITSSECIYGMLAVEAKRSEDHLKGILVMQQKKYCTYWRRDGDLIIFGKESVYSCDNYDIQYREVYQIFNTNSTDYKNQSAILVLKEPFNDIPHVCVDEKLDPFDDNKIAKKYLVYHNTSLADDQAEIVYLAEYNLTQVAELKLGFDDHKISVKDDNFRYICGKSTGSSIFLKTHDNVHYLHKIQNGFGVCNERTKSFNYDTDYDFIKSVFQKLPMIKYDTSPFVYNLKKLQYYDYQNCGRSSVDLELIYEFLISGGYDVNENSVIPWAVQLRDKKFSCSGVLISQRHVITAAHCILNTENAPYKYYDRNIVNDTEIVINNFCNVDTDVDGECINKEETQIRRINRLLYNFRSGLRRHRNDIAVIELDVPVIGVTHVCLPFLHDDYKFDKNKTLIAFGYGSTKRGLTGEKAKVHNRLKKFIYTMPDSFTNCSTQQVPVNSTELLCLNVNLHLGLCPGDSGGGLIQKTFDNRYILIGESSRSTSCIDKDITNLRYEGSNMFVLVENYKDEILNFMHETKTYYPENS